MNSAELRKKVTRQLIGRLSEFEYGFKRKTVRLVLYLAAFYVVYLFCGGDYGLFRIHRLTRERDRLQKDQMAVIAEAADYSQYLKRVKNDPHFVEWLARTKYGYSLPKETIYHLKVTSR